jgi:DNA polymerase V
MKKSKQLKEDSIAFIDIDSAVLKFIPLYEQTVQAGFPSPADDFLDLDINLQDFLIKHPSATFCVRVNGSSMEKANIYSGDVMIVDKSLSPKNNSIVLAVIDSEFTVKRIKKNGTKLYLNPENDAFNPIEITEEMNFNVWGVVTHIIHEV